MDNEGELVSTMAVFSIGTWVKGRRLQPVLGAALMLSSLCTGLGAATSPVGANPNAMPQHVAVKSAPQSSQMGQAESQIWEQLNQARRQSGLQPLQWNPQLAQVARNYSRQMAQNNFYSHTDLNGKNYRQRVESAGIKAYLVGENLLRCRGCGQSRDVVTMSVNSWLKSAGHRHNIMLPMMKETGIGIWQEGDSYYMTQLLIEPKE